MLGEHLESVGSENLLDSSPLSPNSEKRIWNERTQINAAVVLRPGNSSDRNTDPITGACRNLSVSGCGVITNFAPRVGDIYRFETPDTNTHPLDHVYGRCVRCHLLDEDSFESGFAFLSPISLDSLVQERSDDQHVPLV